MSLVRLTNIEALNLMAPAQDVYVLDMSTMAAGTSIDIPDNKGFWVIGGSTIVADTPLSTQQTIPVVEGTVYPVSITKVYKDGNDALYIVFLLT